MNATFWFMDNIISCFMSSDPSSPTVLKQYTKTEVKVIIQFWSSLLCWLKVVIICNALYKFYRFLATKTIACLSVLISHRILFSKLSFPIFFILSSSSKLKKGIKFDMKVLLFCFHKKNFIS